MLGCFPCCGLQDPILDRWLQVGGGIGNAEWRRALEHEDRAGHEEGKTERGRSRQALVEREADEQNRHQDAQFVDGHDRADGAVLQRLEVAEPAAAGGQPRQHEEEKRPPADVRERGLYHIRIDPYGCRGRRKHGDEEEAWR